MSSFRFRRGMRTAQEKRANQENWHRPARRRNALPNILDEYISELPRSWKRYRRTQYKTVDIKG